MLTHVQKAYQQTDLQFFQSRSVGKDTSGKSCEFIILPIAEQQQAEAVRACQIMDAVAMET